MIKTLLFLTALALVQARPSDDAEPILGRLYEVHDDCPPTEVHFLLPHEYDCTKFYYCEYGLKYIEPRSCAPGTEFNANIQVCVHPINSGCTLPGFSTTPGTSPTVGPDTEPTIPEITTPEDETTATTTTAGTIVPETEPTIPEIITTPEDETTATTTTAGTIVPETEPTVPEEITSEPTTPDEDTTIIVTEPTTPSPSVPDADDCETLDNGCPSDFSIHQLLPHEEYCHKFYYCDKGELVLRYCAPGTYFNPKIQVCDWPHNVDCVNDGSYEYPTTSAPTTQPPSPPGDGDNDIGDILDNGCPASFDVHHLLPHETECNKFYYCVFGQKVERSCAPGTYFNYEIQVCDWPANVNCTSTGTTPAPATPEDSSSSEELPIVNDPEDPEDPEDPSGWVPLPNGCPADFNIHHLLPHETDCDKFYYCVHGQTIVRQCAPGTHFNPIKQVCDWPQNAGCENWNGCSGSGNGCTSTTAAPGGNDGTTAAPGGNDGTTAAPGGNDGTTAAPGGNDGTTAAPGGNDGTTAAPGGNDGTTAAPGGNDGTTAVPEDPIEWTPLPNGCPADFDVHHLLPHESDCNKFYYCVNGETLERECPLGTHFSPSQQICDWPQYAGCEHWDGGCSGPGDDNGGCAGTTAAPGGNDGTTAAPGGNDGTTAAPGVNDGTTAAPGGNDGTTAAPGGNDGTTAAPGGNDGTTAAPGGNDGTTAAPGDNDGTTAAPGGNDGTTAAPGGNDGTTAAPGGNDGTTAAPGGNDGTTAAPGGNDGTTAAPGCEACQPPVTPADKCKSGCNVLPFVHDNDCDKYWICNGEQPLLVTCSEGLHFNPSTYTCDFICNAGCRRENVQITTLGEGVKLFLPWGSITSEMMNLLDAQLKGDL